jgi:TPR repeat protein
MRRMAAAIAMVALAAAAARAEQPGPRAPAENKIACEGGDLDACEALARAYRDGDGVARDPARSASYYLRACEAGRAPACTAQAAVLRRSGDKRLLPAARLADLRACVLRRADSCRILLAEFPELDLGPRQVARRTTRACKAGDAAACLMLGHLTSNGLGVERDVREAARLYRRGCDLNVGWACIALARAYESGRGVKKDKVRAAALFRQGCAVDAAVCPPRRR